jgi:hypothetical protein
MDNRDELLLEHIGRYTISIRRIMEELFFDGGSCGNALDRLVEKQLIQRVTKALEGNYSYYQLTVKGAKNRGLPPNKGLAKSGEALAQNLAALWFSCKGHLSRERLTESELEGLFGAPKGQNVIHVAQTGAADQTTVFRLFVPSENTRVKKGYVQGLQKIAWQEMENKRLRPWIDRGTYSFAILVHNSFRKEELERLIPAQDFPKIRIHVELAPTPSTLPVFLPSKEAE